MASASRAFSPMPVAILEMASSRWREMSLTSRRRRDYCSLVLCLIEERDG